MALTLIRVGLSADTYSAFLACGSFEVVSTCTSLDL